MPPHSVIYINVTIYILYGVIISVLFYKHRKNLKAIKDYDEPEKPSASERSSDDDEEIEISKSLRRSDKESLQDKPG